MTETYKMDMPDFFSKNPTITLKAQKPEVKAFQVSPRSLYPLCIQNAVITVFDYLVLNVNIINERFMVNINVEEDNTIKLILNWFNKKVVFEMDAQCPNYALKDFPHNISHEYFVGSSQDLATGKQKNIIFQNTNKTETSGISLNSFLYSHESVIQ